MADIRIDAAHDIGETAGAIWRHLSENGPCSLAKLTKEIEAPRDIIMQGLGWLAREDKLAYTNGPGKSKLVTLK
jgi:hypothetical protein